VRFRTPGPLVGFALTAVLVLPALHAQVVYAPNTAHAYSELIDTYRHADANAAVAEFARWSQTRIGDELNTPKDDADPWLRAASAALALEADLRSVQNLDPEPSNRSLKAVTMMPALLASARRTGDQKLLRFCHDWFVAAGAMAARFRTAGYETTGDVVRLGFTEDPQILLLAGVNAEAYMGPFDGRPIGVGPFDSLRRGMFNHGLAYDAENLSSRALAADASLVEARLHHGRTIFMLGRDRDAQPELEHALHDAIAAGKPGVAYLAALFLGDLHEDAGNAADAAQYFAQATQLQPLAAGGWLALGRHRLSVGQADGWPSAAKVFASPTGLSVEPW
jgi:tetratricopeptide (TPR) repeat protein